MTRRGFSVGWLYSIGAIQYSVEAVESFFSLACGCVFSVRRATAEEVLKEPGFWCDLLDFYGKGHWPLGWLTAGFGLAGRGGLLADRRRG